MKFKVDNIIYMTLYDKEHNPLWTMDAENVTVDTEAEGFEIDGVPKQPKVGDHIYLSANIKGEKTIEIDGFYGGLDD